MYGTENEGRGKSQIRKILEMKPKLFSTWMCGLCHVISFCMRYRRQTIFVLEWNLCKSLIATGTACFTITLRGIWQCNSYNITSAIVP